MTEEILSARLMWEKYLKRIRGFLKLFPAMMAWYLFLNSADGYVGKVEDVVQVGQEISIKSNGIDDQKRVKLSESRP